MEKLNVQRTWPTVSGMKKHTGNDKIYLILQKEKPKYRRITYVRSVCDIITQKKKLVEQEYLQE